MRKFLVLITFMSLFLIKARGQDIHFTQFYQQPLLVNPALGGDYSGGLRASFINRRQWGQLGVPIETLAASVEQKIWLNGDYLILGGLFSNDKASQIGYVTTKGYFSSTYLKNLSRHAFGMGIQAGFSRTALDPNQTFPSQFNSTNGTFDNTLNNNEPFDFLNRSYLGINIGFFWKTIYKDRFRFKTGVSISHINMPNEAFSGGIERIPMRYLAHHSTEIILDAAWSFISQSQAMYTGQAKEFITHALVKRKFSDIVSVKGGLGYRGYLVNSDAAILLLGVSYHYMDIGVSYDWNVSDLSRDTSQKTSVEISLSVRTPPGKKRPVLYRKGKPCPIYVDYY
ncbi:MAG: PorP/SprF family type IX secretion system membrane protein [Bacteroidota bacterium]